MAGWPQEGQWAAEDPGSQDTRGGRSPETGSAFPCVVHGLVRGLRWSPRGEGVAEGLWRQGEPAE